MGTLKNAIQSLLGWDRKTPIYNSKLISANSVVFSTYGNDIRVSDMVKTAIHRVAEAVSKWELKSVIEKENPKQTLVSDDDINAVLTSRVNPFCALKDFLYKVTYLTLVHKNCFIYWQYDEVPIEGTKYVRRVTKGFYPIEAANIKIYTLNGEVRVELSNATNDIVLDLPYSDVIHIRHSYGANAFLGGGADGRPDNRGLLDNLQTMHIIKEAIPKSLEASLSLKGILSMKTVADIDKKAITREEFENHLFDSKYGIVATDYESDFTPININATDIPSNILTFLRDDILSPFGVSLPIYLGKYTDDDYTAFYQTAIEGILLEIKQAMKIVLFTPRQLSYGHTIKFYDKLVQSLSYDRRQQIAEMTKEDALLSRDERRELLGYEPDGQPTRVSLNFIDTSIANQYQLADISNKSNQINKEENNATNQSTNNS
ncbi:MAG: phage portal protein [Clostridia bacterium]|nr:phage portal protein [Clostridia bacterium]